MAPTLAGTWGGVCRAGSHGQRLCGIWAPGPCSAHAGPLLSSEVPPLLTPALASRSQPSFPGWGHHGLPGAQRYPNRSFAHKGVSWVLGSQVWTSVCQAFLFSYFAFSPSISKHPPTWPSPVFTCTFLSPISSCNMKLGRSGSEGEDVGVAPWSLGRDFQLCPRAVNSGKVFPCFLEEPLISSGFS